MINLSELFRDPYLKRIFSRAERDGGASFTIPAPVSPAPKSGAAARKLEVA